MWEESSIIGGVLWKGILGPISSVYVINETKKSHDPKQLGREHGGMLTGLFNYPCYIVHLPRDGTAHNGLGPPTSISHQENVLQECAQADQIKAIPHLK